VIILWRNFKINKFKAFSVKLKTDSVNNMCKRLCNLDSCLEKGRVKLEIYKNDLKGLTTEQKDVLVGLLLADGFLEKRRANHNTRLRVDHTYPAQEAYVKYLYKLFKSMCGKQPVIYIRKPDKRTGKIYSSIAFKTYNLSCLNEYYVLFYKNSGDIHLSGQPRYIKIVPSNVQELLTPVALAH